MATRAKSPRADEDALDPVEAADLEAPDDADEGLLELEEPDVIKDDEDDEDDDLEDDVEDPADDGPEGLAPHDDATGELPPLDADDTADVTATVLDDAAFDDDADEVTAVVSDLDDDDDEVEGVRDGEFVCRSCYMAKRDTQLADAERLLCRDCA